MLPIISNQTGATNTPQKPAFLPTGTAAANPTAGPTIKAPTQAVTPAEVFVKARISHYWPALGGTNCARFVNGQCLSKMSSGQPWQNWIDKACACPAKYPFGTSFIVDGKEWVCMDRGGAIVVTGAGEVWLDLLTEHATRPYGQVVTVEVRR
jgi:hypothetical protein